MGKAHEIFTHGHPWPCSWVHGPAHGSVALLMGPWPCSWVAMGSHALGHGNPWEPMGNVPWAPLRAHGQGHGFP